jgi:hypothetical protein
VGGPRVYSWEDVTPDRDDEFLRLALMSVADLETHIDRLERDLDDLKNGIDHPDD